MIRRRNRFFTLVEIIAVTIIIAVIATVAVSAFKGESPSVKFLRSAQEFENFCASVRYRSMEEGDVRAIAFEPEERYFEMRVITIDDDGKVISDAGEKPLRWNLPEGFEIDREALGIDRARELFADDYGIEIFRIYPTGCASGIRTFSFTYKDITRTFGVSPLTGTIRLTAEETLK